MNSAGAKGLVIGLAAAAISFFQYAGWERRKLQQFADNVAVAAVAAAVRGEDPRLYVRKHVHQRIDSRSFSLFVDWPPTGGALRGNRMAVRVLIVNRGGAVRLFNRTVSATAAVLPAKPDAKPVGKLIIARVE